MMNETKPPDEREYIEALMLDAIDGNLTKSGERELSRFLEADPSLAEELKLMQGVDDLFNGMGMVEPPVDFVANTMAVLPRAGFNRWLVGLGVALVMLFAMAPVVIGVYIFNSIPAQEAVLQLTQAFLEGMAQLILNLAQATTEQPLAFVVPILMIGSIFLWATLYRRMVGALVPARG